MVQGMQWDVRMRDDDEVDSIAHESQPASLSAPTAHEQSYAQNCTASRKTKATANFGTGAYLKLFMLPFRLEARKTALPSSGPLPPYSTGGVDFHWRV